MIKIQIKSIYGSILFEWESENNTIKETVEKANLSDADLRCADLRCADLRCADLRCADLSGANLSGANLRCADLRCADLRCADLSGANLSDADLSGANLSGANLRCADLRCADLSGAKNKETAYLPIFCKWSNCIHGDKIRIGCKEKTIEDWDQFFASTEEYSTKRDTEEFKQIQAVYESLKAYYLFSNK